MIQWGGSQNGILQKFDDGIGEVDLRGQIEDVITNITSPKVAIELALKMPGMGLTYASKLLRFLDPNRYGALDSRLRKAFSDRLADTIPKIYDGNVNSMTNGYVKFIDYLVDLNKQLEAHNIVRPDCAFPKDGTVTGWRIADIEMALFQWA
jgi:hypothetical protein